VEKNSIALSAKVPQGLELQYEISSEAQSYLRGLVDELRDQNRKYFELTRAFLSLEARVDLAEQTVCLTRDHLARAIELSDSTAPFDWLEVLNEYRFVGVRLAEACQILLKEQKRMTPQDLLIGLNKGMFRFRTSSPLREIHAALLRQNFAKKEDQHWIWVISEKPELTPTQEQEEQTNN
jgi:hypothetical protein